MENQHHDEYLSNFVHFQKNIYSELMFKCWNHFHLQHKIVIHNYTGISQVLPFKHYVVSCEPCEDCQTFVKRGWDVVPVQQHGRPATEQVPAAVTCPAQGREVQGLGQGLPAGAARRRGWIQSLWAQLCGPLLHLGRRWSVRHRPQAKPSEVAVRRQRLQ